MRRRTMLTGPAVLAASVAAVVGLTRCEGRMSDDFGVQVSEVKGLTVDEVQEVGVRALEYALALAPDRSVAVCLTDREGRILFEAVTVNQVTGDSLLTRNFGVGTTNTGDATAQATIARAESRALVGSFFSSEGEAFSVQTAFFIIQENFPPGTKNEDVGPLFGVENSSFIASDIIQISRFDVRDQANRNLAVAVNDVTDPAFQGLIDSSIGTGANNLPNGGANATGAGVVGAIAFNDPLQPEDKGGLPLHRLGAHVGGIGVAGATMEDNLDIAIAGQFGFSPPPNILATRVFVDGVRFPYGRTDFRTVITGVPERPLSTLVNAGLIQIVQGPRSTLQTSTSFPFDFNLQIPPTAYVQARSQTLQNALATPQAIAAGITDAEDAGELFGIFPIRDSASKVRLLLPNQNQGGTVRIQGDIKDAWRSSPNEAEDPSNLDATRDFRQVTPSRALEFDDVAIILRNAAEMALSTRAGIRRPLGLNAVVHFVVTDQNGRNLGSFAMDDATVFSYDVAYQKARGCAFFSDEQVAFSARAIGWVAQPHFPPGIDTTAPGPVFGIQALYNPLGNLLHPAMNGFEVFPGGLPLYREGELIGAIGISGDGVDQDDQIAFGGQLPPFSAPANVRCDVVDEVVVVAGLSRGLSKIRGATVAAIANLQAQAPLSAGQQSTLNTLQSLLNLVDFRLGELQNPNRLTGVPIPWFKFARKPFLFDSD